MSAVRMVAYGVLEMKHKTPSSLWLNEQSPAEQDRLRKEDFERDQLRKLVNDELRSYGLLLSRAVVPNGTRSRTRANTYILYGQVYGPSNNPGLLARPTMHEGDFTSCCVVAARLLDQLDAAQIPDVKT